MIGAATLAAVAIVTQDQASLRAAPSATSTRQAVLWQGELLEIRGRRLDHLQVYDYRRERGGYVHASLVHVQPVTEAEAPQILAVLRFLRDKPGSEALGIAYAAAYLRAAPDEAITAELFDALGTMAERLGDRASRRGGAESATAHLEVVGSYGVRFKAIEGDGAGRLCYDGDAYRRVLAMAASAAQQARAALALTRPDCVDPAMRASERPAFELWRADLLDRIAPEQLAELEPALRNRVRARRAAVWATVGTQRARAGQAPASAVQRAIDELAAVDQGELTDDDRRAVADAALRVGAVRWGALPATAANPVPARGKPAIVTEPGEPGQTCVRLVDPARGHAELARRCTFGIVWPASARAAPDGRTLTLAVQNEAWTQLWVFRAQRGGWTVDPMSPSTDPARPGYIEFAGWVPGGRKMLVAREWQDGTQFKRSFEVVSLDTLVAERRASAPDRLLTFSRWQDPGWKRQTLSLR